MYQTDSSVAIPTHGFASHESAKTGLSRTYINLLTWKISTKYSISVNEYYTVTAVDCSRLEALKGTTKAASDQGSTPAGSTGSVVATVPQLSTALQGSTSLLGTTGASSVSACQITIMLVETDIAAHLWVR